MDIEIGGGSEWLRVDFGNRFLELADQQARDVVEVCSCPLTTLYMGFCLPSVSVRAVTTAAVL